MWRSISLRNRLNLIFASLFALWLVADAIHDVWQASGRSRVETQSAMRVTKDFVATTLALSPEAPEPEVVKNLVASLQHLRHVRAGMGDPSLASAILSEANKESEAPRWFRALVGAPAEVAVIPVAMKNGVTESIILVADPADEIDEVWDEARENALEGGLMALAAIGLSSLLVGRAVRPLGVAGATLSKLEAGDYSARAEGDGPPEIRNLNAKVNSLAETLDGLNRANDELMGRVFDAHDEQRQLIAHELHDEFGPHLFALRASAAVLAKTIGDQPAARAAASAIEAQVGELQGQNRRILADLRPAALEELGLVEALEALVAHWRRAAPKILVSLDVDPRVDASRRASKSDGLSLRARGDDQRVSPRRRHEDRGVAEVRNADRGAKSARSGARWARHARGGRWPRVERRGRSGDGPRWHARPGPAHGRIGQH